MKYAGLVSIGLPTYNRAASLRRAISSALAQDYESIELVISDDASSDDTQILCEEIRAQDCRARYLRQRTNCGLTVNFQEVLRQSRGEFFMWLADDDWLDTSYVSECVKYLESHRDYVLVAGTAGFFSRDGRLLAQGECINLDEEEGPARVAHYYWVVDTNSVMYGVMRRDKVADIEHVNTLGGDWLIVGAMALRGKIKTLEHVSINRTAHGVSKSIASIVSTLHLPAIQERLPYTSISLSILKYVGFSASTFRNLGALNRLRLGCRAAATVFRRYVLWRWWARQARRIRSIRNPKSEVRSGQVNPGKAKPATMKVLIISAAFPPMRAGESDHTFHLCQHLQERGLDVHVLTGTAAGRPISTPFSVSPVMRNWGWGDLFRLGMFLRRLKPDAILLNYSGWLYQNHPMITFLPTVSRALGIRGPCVPMFGIPQGALGQLKSLVVRAGRFLISRWAGTKDADYLYGTLLRDSDRIIVLSEQHRDELREHFARLATKCLIIPPPPLLHVLPESDGQTRLSGRGKLGIDAGAFVFIYFGYVYPGKGVETLIRAFALVTRQRPLARLVIVGGGLGASFDKPSRASYIEDLRHMTQTLGIAEKIVWTEPYPSDSDLASLYLRAADACVLPFDMGIAIHRSSVSVAVTHGLPLISTRGSDLEAPLVDGENILLCPPCDHEALADAMQRLMTNPELKRRLEDGALALAGTTFSWRHAIDKTIQAFELAV